jgi:hypothetical protein
MPKTIFDTTSRRSLLDRIARLRPDSPRRWGTMTPNQMICHLEDSMRCATGMTPTQPRNMPTSNRVLRWLIIYVMPWPRGKVKTSKEMLLTRPGKFEDDKRRLQKILEKAASLTPRGSWSPHPAFGDLSGRDYGVLIHRHVDYHLRQFGV